jgi:hypothetical protein
VFLHIGVLMAACFLPLVNAAASGASAGQPLLREVAAAVTPAELHSTISTLVGFGTRHTLSETASDSRGIGAARRWVQAASPLSRRNAATASRWSRRRRPLAASAYRSPPK